MKVEVELSEIEAIRKENERLREEVSELNSTLAELNEDELIEKAKHLARKLTEKSMRQIIQSLGFNTGGLSPNIIRYECRTEDLWCSDKSWNITVGASISDSFKHAFLNIGVVPPSERDKIKLTLDGE